MSRAGLPYARLLKHNPSQARSIGRVDAILNAAAALLNDREPNELTIRGIAEAARVPTGTIYQFFDDKDAIVQALAVRYIAAFGGLLDPILARQASSWAQTVDGIVDAYAGLIRRQPAIRRLWLSGTLSTQTRALEAETDTEIAAMIGRTLQQVAGRQGGTAVQWRALVVIIDAFLRYAFTVDPRGDTVILGEGKRAARAYAAYLLGAATEHSA